jgi:hypothetical protein
MSKFKDSNFVVTDAYVPENGSLWIEYEGCSRRSARCPCGKGYVSGGVVRAYGAVRCTNCHRPFAEWTIDE